MQLISKEAAIEELQSIANTIKGVGEWERYFEGLKLGYLSAAKALLCMVAYLRRQLLLMCMAKI